MSFEVSEQTGGNGPVQNVTAQPTITFLLVLVVLLPAIVALGILYRQSLPAPYQDDYTTILAFAVDYNQLPTLQKKLLYIAAAQSNEYKLGFEHSIVAFEIELTHDLNFGFLNTLGDLFLLPLGYLLWRTYREDKNDLRRSLLAFLPISFLFFSLTYWENLNWVTTGLQNIPVIFFSLLAVYLLLSRNMVEPPWTRLSLACLAAALAAFTSANGFLLGPVGLLVLLPRRAYARSLVWCASFVIPLVVYLYHYTRLVHPVMRTSYITRPLFFLAFLGCGAVPSRWPAAVLGVVIVGVFWLAVRSRFDRINPVAFYFTVWIVGTALLVAWVRGAAIFGIGSRYSIYSILVLIFCYSFLSQFLAGRGPSCNRKRFYVACLGLAVCICLFANIHAYGKLGGRRQMVLTGIELYRADPQANSPMIDQNLLKGFPAEREYEQRALTNAIQKHVYTLPPKGEIR
jgi:hypothetical protein